MKIYITPNMHTAKFPTVTALVQETRVSFYDF
jgi:hypothetical protein